MPEINIIEIKPTPGLSTQEKILALIQQAPQGVTVRDLSQTLNRPVSMIQQCLKLLKAEGKIYSQQCDNGMHLVYYPGSRPKRIKKSTNRNQIKVDSQELSSNAK